MENQLPLVKPPEADSKLKIEELSMKAKEIEKNSVNVMEPGQKARRGRPPGSTKKSMGAKPQSSMGPENPMRDTVAAPAHEIPTRRIVEPFVTLISKAGGAYAGDKRAEMSPKELNDVADALGLVVDKWMPVLGKDYGAEVLLATTITAYGLRVVAIKKTLEAESRAMQENPVDTSRPLTSQLSIPVEPQPMPAGQYVAQNLSL